MNSLTCKDLEKLMTVESLIVMDDPPKKLVHTL